MTKKRLVETDEDVVVAINDVFGKLPQPETAEEVDAELRRAGYDPEDVGRRLSAFVDDIVRTERSTIAEEKATEFRALSSRMQQLELPNTRIGVIEAINDIVARKEVASSAHYRNFDKQSDDDLRELLRELLALNDDDEGE